MSIFQKALNSDPYQGVWYSMSSEKSPNHIGLEDLLNRAPILENCTITTESPMFWVLTNKNNQHIIITYYNFPHLGSKGFNFKLEKESLPKNE